MTTSWLHLGRQSSSHSTGNFRIGIGLDQDEDTKQIRSSEQNLDAVVKDKPRRCAQLALPSARGTRHRIKPKLWRLQ